MIRRAIGNVVTPGTESECLGVGPKDQETWSVGVLKDQRVWSLRAS